MKKLDHKQVYRWLKIGQVVFGLLIVLFVILAIIYNGHPSSANGTGAGATGFPDLVKAIQQGVSGLIGVIGVVMTIAGGLVYATSQGNPNQMNLGRDIVVSAISGLALYGFSSWLLGGNGISQFFPVPR
jgi:hypothetical protein